MQQETLLFHEQLFEPRKQCPLCNGYKLLSQFYNWSNGRKSPYCKVCENKEAKRTKQAQKDKIMDVN